MSTPIINSLSVAELAELAKQMAELAEQSAEQTAELMTKVMTAKERIEEKRTVVIAEHKRLAIEAATQALTIANLTTASIKLGTAGTEEDLEDLESTAATIKTAIVAVINAEAPAEIIAVVKRAEAIVAAAVAATRIGLNN